MTNEDHAHNLPISDKEFKISNIWSQNKDGISNYKLIKSNQYMPSDNRN